MTHFWTVWKIQFRQTLGVSSIKYLYRTNKSGLLRRLLFVPLLVLIMAPALKLIADMYGLLFSTLHQMGQDAVVFALAFVFTQSLSFIFGLFYLMSNFYFSRDLELLIPLPLKPSVILGSKFLTVVLTEYTVILPVVVPAFWVYSRSSPAWWFWLLAAVVTLLLPVIPLALASIFVILLMRITNVRSGRGVMRVFGAAAGIVFYLGFQWLQIRFRSGGPESFSALIARPDSLVHLIARRFPPSFWAAEGLLKFPAAEGLYYTFLYFLVTAAALLMLFVLADRFFFKGLVGGNEVSVKRKTRVTTSGLFRARSPMAALFLREWRNLVRSASFLMPVLINFIIVPVAVLIPLVSGQNTVFSNLPALAQNTAAHQIIILVVSGLTAFISANNGLAPTAISREGKSFWISRVIPVSAFTQVISKLAVAALVPVFLILLALVGERLLFHFGFFELFTQTILALTGSLVTLSFGLLIDMLRPKLNWTDPQQVMKRNLTVLISTFSSLAFVALSGAFCYWLAAGLALSPGAVVGIITTLYLLLLGILVWLIYNRAGQLYSKIEV